MAAQEWEPSQEGADQTIADEPMLRWFRYDHLRPEFQEMPALYSALARTVCVRLPRSPERTVALRKLLESKDAATRCTVALSD